MKELSSSSPEEQMPSNEPPFSNEPPTYPKDYDKALKRVTQALEEQQPSSTLEKVVFGVGLFLCFILLLSHLLDWLSYPHWLELFYHFSIFVEASLPLFVSFFLKNKQQATILQIAGTITLLMYLLA